MRFPGRKLYRKLRYRKGFGIHSPFVYNLITKVIEEKSSYYAFEEIEQFRSSLLKREDFFSRITAKEAQSPKYGAFLFRLINFLKCENVVQIGSSTGVIGLYLAMASPTKKTCYLMEERIGFLQFVSDFLMARNLRHVRILEGDYKENIKKIPYPKGGINMLFIDHFPEKMTPQEVMNMCKCLLGEKSIIVINDILKNKQTKELWLKAKEDSLASSSLDLYKIGIISFNKKHPKKHYKAYFSYGKKQSLHSNRRRRLYFLSWRKKSSQNQSSY